MTGENLNKTYKAISLFSGGGGGDLGFRGGFDYLGKNYKKNNVEFIHISDIDKFAVQTLRENFDPLAQNIDIKELDLVGYEADIILGGFPCQSFSTVNPTKDPYDDRAQLYKQMLRLVEQVKPKVVIGENVKGLALLQKGEILKKIIREFEALGYRVQHSILNAADYGIPQKRQRLFIVGVRNDVETEFVFPEATHSEGGLFGKPWVPLSKVIDKLAIEDKKYYFSERAVQGLKNAKHNMKRGLAQNLNEPSLTLTSHLAKISLNSRDPVLLVDKEKELYRRFTVREAARIQSFPDNFKFPVSDHQAYRQIGNAIPPVLMWHMSQQALKVLDNEN